MKIKFDWKFWIVLVFTVAGVLVPVWIWKADMTARALHFRKISQTALHPPDTAKALGLKILAAGTEVPVPYLTVFELANDGAKPILAADFESPIELIPASKKATIVRASVTGVKPSDILPTLEIDSGAVKIKPMLTNSGDVVTIAVLTSGEEEPSFSARARIAGISQISIIDDEARKPSLLRSMILIGPIVLCLAVASIAMDGWVRTGVHIRPRAATAVAAVSALAGGGLLAFLLSSFGDYGFKEITIATSIFMFIGILVGNWLNKVESHKEGVQNPARRA